MNLNNKRIYNSFDTLDLVKEVKYERDFRREFCEKPISVRAKDIKRKRRSMGFGQWCLRILIKK